MRVVLKGLGDSSGPSLSKTLRVPTKGDVGSDGISGICASCISVLSDFLSWDEVVTQIGRMAMYEV